MLMASSLAHAFVSVFYICPPLQAALADALERVRQVLASSHDLALQVC